jgi:hypothetical protein
MRRRERKNRIKIDLSIAESKAVAMAERSGDLSL